MDIVLNIAICQINIEAFQSIKFNNFFKIPKKRFDNSDWSDNNKFVSFKTLKKSIFLVL